MTTRTGSVLVGTIDKFRSGTETRPTQAYPGAVLVNAVTIGSSPPIYKNQGWYAAGSVFEVWVSTPLPSTFPPSGHTLTDIEHTILQS
ncbi:MAG TPA: hypothetical protein VLE97_01865 [Gaiellaceae bacterium]|nr:hypothetical protein [Gaiellaceae bacterium]